MREKTMIASTNRCCPEVRMALMIACTIGISLGITIANGQTTQSPLASGDSTPATKKSTDEEKRIVIQLVDEDGQPVTGAKVCKRVGLDDPFTEGRQLSWRYPDVSDDNGQVTLYAEAFGPATMIRYIQHEERGIGTIAKVPREYEGPRPPIVLTPICHVHGSFNIKNVPAADIPLEQAFITVSKAGTSQWLLQGGVSLTQECDFDLPLPAGKYLLTACPMVPGGKAGPAITTKVRWEMRTILVAPGEKNLDLGEIGFRPTRVWSLIGKPAPEIGPIKAWENGSPVTLADLRGQVVLLHLGGGEPSPAIFLPRLVELHNAFADKGLTIIAVYNCDSMEELDRKWAKAYKRDLWLATQGQKAVIREVPFRIAVDGGDPTFYEGTDVLRHGATYGQYDIVYGPTNVLIDQAGNIVKTPDDKNLDNTLAEMLGLPVTKPQLAVWEPRFHALYRLDEGQVLKHVAPPFIPERAEYFKDKFKDCGVPLEIMISRRVIFQWSGGLQEMDSANGGESTDLESILQDVFRLQETEYKGPADLLHLKLPGDWIVRPDSSLEARFLALEEIIASELGRKIQFEYCPIERSVIVATGRFRLRSPSDVPDAGLIHLYATEAEPESRGNRWQVDSIDAILRMLRHRTRIPVIDRTEHEESSDISFFVEHSSIWLRDVQDPQEKQRRLQLLCDHLAEQTLLRLEVRTEPLPTWCITERED